MSAVIVENALATNLTSLITREFILERSHMSAVNVGNLSDNAPMLLPPIQVILGKSFMSVANVGNHLAINLLKHQRVHTGGEY